MRQAPESQADIYAKEYKAQGIQKAQNEVNNYTSQLNAITAKAQAESLGLEGQGRGVTESIIGGQQAKINREAAIQALPVQAQLAAAQGNLEFAQQQLNTVFQLKVADSKAKTDYWNGLVDTAMNFATTAQQNILNAKLADINTRSQKEQANLSLVNQWAQMAVETGQSGLISKFTALDPKSPTFTQDFGKLQAQVVDPNVSLDLEAKRANIANIYSQINSRAVSAREAVLEAATEAEKVQQEKVADSEQALEISQLANQLADMAGFSSAVGFGVKKSPFARFIAGAGTGAAVGGAGGSLLGPLGTAVGAIGGGIAGGIGGLSVGGDAIAGTSRADFEATATRLSNLLTLDNLSLMKGVLTDRDVQLLATAGSNLGNFDMSEQQYASEINRVVDIMNRTVENNGITLEQAQFYKIISPEDALSLDAIWNNL
jgi:hypothetical protein